MDAIDKCLHEDVVVRTADEGPPPWPRGWAHWDITTGLDRLRGLRAYRMTYYDPEEGWVCGTGTAMQSHQWRAEREAMQAAQQSVGAQDAG